MQYSSEQMKFARQADLYNYLKTKHIEYFKIVGNSIHPKNNNSLSIKRGYSGYMDFATGETGNAVDFLVKYMGYSITEAVIALCENMYDISLKKNITESKLLDVNVKNESIIFPEPVKGKYKQLFAYLMGRGIPSDTIQMLIDEKVIYQEKEHNNIVFINKEKDFAELHGTLTFGKSFHGCRKKSSDCFWWFRTAKDAEIAYICEAAIDAISLYLLNKKNNNNIPAYYISIAGVANQQTIERIKRQTFIKKIIIAVDNDEAGQQCRDRNWNFEFMIPKYKDWNEDLVKDK